MIWFLGRLLAGVLGPPCEELGSRDGCHGWGLWQRHGRRGDGRHQVEAGAKGTTAVRKAHWRRAEERQRVELERQVRGTGARTGTETGLRARVLDNEAFSRIGVAQPPQCDTFGGYVDVFPIWTEFGPNECSQTATAHILRAGEQARRRVYTGLDERLAGSRA